MPFRIALKFQKTKDIKYFKTTKHSLHIKNHYYKYEDYLEIWEHTHQIMSNERRKQNIKWYIYMWWWQLSPWATVTQVPQCQGPQSDPHHHDPSTSETSFAHKIKFNSPSPAPRPAMIWPCRSPTHPQPVSIHPTSAAGFSVPWLRSTR